MPEPFVTPKTAPDPIQRQRDALRTFRQADRARREAEAAVHKPHEQATSAADAAHQTARQNAENTRKQNLSAAQSQQQSAQRSAGSALESTRNRAQQQIGFIDAALRNGRALVHNAGLDHLWPAGPTKTETIASAQAEAELARYPRLAEQSEALANAVNNWKKEQTHAARRRRTEGYAALAGLVLFPIIFVIVVQRFQERQSELRIQAAATAQAVAVQVTATAQAEIAQATTTAIASLAFPDRMKAITGIEFVEVPAGEFLMGSPDGEGQNSEHPQHTVYMDAFWIGRTEVTNVQYARCVEAGGCRAPANSRWDDSAYADHPVTDVSWHDAVAYTRWLSQASGVEVRLPTEAEWEKACRGALPSPGAGEGSGVRVYPWGDAQPSAELLNFDESGIGDTTAVGSYPAGASPYGALDMAGNVWEWVGDWYDEGYYSRSPQRNPTGPESGSYRVLRGGSFLYGRDGVRCASRDGYSPVNRHRLYGFRLLSPGS